MHRAVAVLFLTIVLSTPAFAGEAPPAHAGTLPKPAYEPLYAGLGDVHHPVTTKSEQAQKYFDQGLAFDYGFNHDEAYQSFAAAAALDPTMAMADWGIALVFGPNYNLPGNDERMKIAYGSIQRAESLEGSATPEEKALIEALSKRYGADGKQTPVREAAYADAMRVVRINTRRSRRANAVRRIADGFASVGAMDQRRQAGSADRWQLLVTLEGTLKKYPEHLGANHYYIHAVEASPHPERALPSARRLATIAPMQGHLTHMPSHIYVRTGMYHDSSIANEAAIKSDQEFLAKSHESGVYPVMYASHNYDFLLYSEMMEGRKRDAIKTARALKGMVPPEVVKAMPIGEFVWPKPYFAMARFGDVGRNSRGARAAQGIRVHHRDVALRPRPRIRGYGKTRRRSRGAESARGKRRRDVAGFSGGPEQQGRRSHKTRSADFDRRHRERARRS